MKRTECSLAQTPLGLVLAITALVLIVAAVHYAIPYPLDDDTAYHFSVGTLLREQGILHRFPWTRFSWQFDHYADKEFFFHLLFVPFTGLGYETASRVVGTLCGAGVLVTLFLILRAEKVRYAFFWTLLPLGTMIFLYRFCQVRPHLLSIGLAMVLLWSYCRQKPLLLFFASLLYPLCYVAFWQIPLILVLAAEGGRLWTGGRFRWQHSVTIGVGLILGLILHPNTINLLQMNWIHMTDILFRNAWGKHVEFNLGEEFEPFTLIIWLREMMVPTVAMVLAVAGAWRSRRDNPFAVAVVLAMVFFLLLTLRSNRFLEYSVPFAMLALAVVTIPQRQQLLVMSLAGLSLCWTIIFGTPMVQYLFFSQDRPWQLNDAVVGVFKRAIPPGATVFTCGWEYTGTLMAELPNRQYMVALDPTLLYKRDPSLYDLWYQTLKTAPPASADVVRRQFKSRYVVCLDHPTLHPFFDVLAADPQTSIVHSDGKWVLFDLEGRR